ncbi:MAG: acyltransferase 3, partial [Frankiales bacterium]|nr:acyltransferase 3 [Frankiales bacterium]
VWGLCVDFFFMLSGFVLCQSFLRRPPGPRAYEVKRLFRLAPMFLLSTAVALALTSRLDWGAWTIAANLLMVQSLLGLKSINMVSWSIPFELFFPAVGLLFVGRAAGWPRLALWLLFGAALAIQSYTTFALAAGPDHMAWRAASGLLAGALLFLLRRHSLPPASRTASGISLVAFGFAVLVMATAGMHPTLAAAFPAFAALAIWFGASAQGLFSTPPLQALGRWSYSIYLVHIPLLLTVNAVFGERAILGSIPAKAAMVTGVIGLAALCYRLVEAPLIELGKQVERRLPPSAIIDRLAK